MTIASCQNTKAARKLSHRGDPPSMDKRTASWGMAIVMCLVNAVAFIDRTSLPLLVQPITRDLKISDTQMSLLIGLAFIFTYSIGGLFVGALVDRFPRRRILSLSMAFWGASTILCGTTFNYLVMFVGQTSRDS